MFKYGVYVKAHNANSLNIITAELLGIVIHSDSFMCSKGDPDVLELGSLFFGS